MDDPRLTPEEIEYLHAHPHVQPEVVISMRPHRLFMKGAEAAKANGVVGFWADRE
jgi:hypothetical protein